MKALVPKGPASACKQTHRSILLFRDGFRSVLHNNSALWVRAPR